MSTEASWFNQRFDDKPEVNAARRTEIESCEDTRQCHNSDRISPSFT